MPYGIIKVDTVTFTDNGVDKNISLSGLVQNPTFTGNVTATGTISGDVIRGGTTISGVTVTGTTANFVSGVFTTQVSGATIIAPTGNFTSLTGTTTTGTTANFASGVFTTQVSGVTVIATTGTFTSLTGTTTTGTTANFASGVFTTQLSGVTITGTTVAATTGSFTSLTGTTTTGTTANFASGVFTTQVSGATVIAPTGTFTSLTGTTATFTSGIIASGTAALPSLAILSDPNTGIFSPGADQLAISTNGTRRLLIDATGALTLDTGDATIYGVRVGRGASAISTNTAVGNNALNAITTGGLNTAMGGNALQANIDGVQNTAVGYNALIGNTSGSYNTAYGLNALFGNISGSNNTCIGNPAGIALTTGSNNTIIGCVGGAAGLADTVIIAAGATERLRITSTNTLNFVGAGSPGATQTVSLSGSAPINSIVLDSGGKLGLGAPSPQQSLDTIGNIRLSSGGSRVIDFLQSVGAAAYTGPGFYSSSSIGFGISAGGTYRFIGGGNGNTDIMRLTDAGLLGIGTTSPGQVLDVVGDAQIGPTSGSGTLLLGVRGFSASLRYNGGTGDLDIAPRGGFGIAFKSDSGGTTERARIDSSGRLLVGTSTARSNLYDGTLTAALQVEGTTYNTSSLSMIANGASSTGNPYPICYLGRSRGASVGLNTILASNDVIGEIVFAGATGTNLVTTATIKSLVDGTPAGPSPGPTSMPSCLVFSTTPDGTTSPTERMRIKSNGIINFSNAPTHADNTAATAAGLAVGDVYKTVLGVLMIRF